MEETRCHQHNDRGKPAQTSSGQNGSAQLGFVHMHCRACSRSQVRHGLWLQPVAAKMRCRCKLIFKFLRYSVSDDLRIKTEAGIFIRSQLRHTPRHPPCNLAQGGDLPAHWPLVQARRMCSVHSMVQDQPADLMLRAPPQAQEKQKKSLCSSLICCVALNPFPPHVYTVSAGNAFQLKSLRGSTPRFRGRREASTLIRNLKP